MTPDIVVPISVFAMIFGIVYIMVRKSERMAMLQKGVDPGYFDKKKGVSSDLKWGMLLVGIGGGILLGKVISACGTLSEETAIFSMICLLGGISLVIYHFMERNIQKKNSQE